MSGIVFFRTESRPAVVEWYADVVGADVWLEQPGCTICSFDGFRFGFCDADGTENCGILTFVYPDREGVDRMHDRVGDAAREGPHVNETYDIYQFFADDPDGRTAEFQTFLADDGSLG
ncbi:VOC family protein [Halorarum halobium]|uniref:VOC family protein n=1 Tax=Halorarum halobium TaxID=3075121 RepID=UPI0028A8E9F7|nr:VOC family protein [Halobaculum sp. XH14]